MTMLADLAVRYGTPLYVYDLARIRAAVTALRAALPQPSQLYYSVKANAHPAVVAEVRAAGAQAEVSSPGELCTALERGHPPSGCLYTGPGKSRQELADAVGRGVRLFSVESATERDRLSDVASSQHRTVDFVVRLNAGAGGPGGLRMTGRASQFGVDAEAADSVLRPAPAARPIGVHLFPATNMRDEQALAREFEGSVRAAVAVLDRVGLPARLIDLGGGFAAPFARPGSRPTYPGLRDALTRVLDRHLPGWRIGAPTIAFESGRYLVGDCGTLLTTVLDVKHSRGTRFVVLDAGINVLGGMGGVGRLLAPQVQPVPMGGGAGEFGQAGELGAADELGAVGQAGEFGDAGEATLTGPLCTPLDVLGRGSTVGAVRPDSVLEIPNVGAYGLSASLVAFLSRPPTTEVVIDGTEVVAARRLELTPVELAVPATRS